MATTLYLRTGVSELYAAAGETWRYASTVRGATSVTAIINTALGPHTPPTTATQLTISAGGSRLVWLSAPLAAGATISGSVTFNIRARESGNAANATVTGRVVRCAADGTILADIVQPPGTVQTELSTSDSARNFSATPTSTAVAAGERIGIILYIDDGSGVTMASGQTVTVSYDGPSAAAAGDTYVTLSENLTFADLSPILQDNFETGDTSRALSVTTASGSGALAAVNTTAVKNGTYGGQFASGTAPAASGNSAFVYTVNALPGTSFVALQAWIKPISLSAGGGAAIALLLAQADLTRIVGLGYSSAVGWLMTYRRRDGVNVTTLALSTQLTTSAWNLIQLTYDWTGANPVFTCYLNGAQVATFTDTTAGSVLVPGRVRLGWQLSAAPVTEGEIYADDLYAANAFISAGTTHNGAAALTGEGALASAGVLSAAGALSVSGAGALASSGVLGAAGALSLEGAGAFTSLGVLKASGALALSGDGALSTLGALKAAGALSLSGEGSLTTLGALLAGGAATFAGAGSFSALGILLAAGGAVFTGEGALLSDGAVSAGGISHVGASSLAGEGALLSSGAILLHGALTLSGEGALVTAGVLSAAGTLALAGEGALFSGGVLVIAGASVFSGAGVLLSDGTLVVLVGNGEAAGSVLLLYGATGALALVGGAAASVAQAHGASGSTAIVGGASGSVALRDGALALVD